MILPERIVGHLAPDLDCIAAIWILRRFGGASSAELVFVPAGSTYSDSPADADPRTIHVDTGLGRFDHHNDDDDQICAAELVRRAVAPNDPVLERLVRHVVALDHAHNRRGDLGNSLTVNDLIHGYNSLYPDDPTRVTLAMLPNLDAWYAQEELLMRMEQAFKRRIEFQTRWGKGIAVESEDGGSSRLAYREGAVIYAYRDGRGFCGIAAQANSSVNLSSVYTALLRADPGADWYLHPNKRLLLCGTAKSPVRHLSELSLEALVDILKK